MNVFISIGTIVSKTPKNRAWLNVNFCNNFLINEKKQIKHKYGQYRVFDILYPCT